MGEKGKRIRVYGLILWKRMWKTHKVFPLFFLIPLLLVGINRTFTASEANIRVAVYMEKESEEMAETLRGGREEASEILQGQLENHEGAVTFHFYTSEEQIKQAVATTEAECGYCIPADWFERMQKGNYRRSIKSYQSPETSLYSICEEMLFAEMFEVYETVTFGEQMAELITEDSGEQEIFSAEEIEERAEELFEKYLYNGSTFGFIYERTEQVEAQNNPSAQVIPLRGIMALFIYICGLCGTLDALEDEHRGKLGKRKDKWCFQLLTIYMPVLMMSVVTIVCLFLGGEGTNLLAEAGKLLGYQLLMVLYGVVLKGICKKEERLAAAMPVLILAAVVVCPVFVDLSALVPVCKVLAKAFPLAYYLG